MAEGENGLLQVVFWLPHVCRGMHTYMGITIIKDKVESDGGRHLTLASTCVCRGEHTLLMCVHSCTHRHRQVRRKTGREDGCFSLLLGHSDKEART